MPEQPTTRRGRLSRDERKALTRAQLIASARTVFARRGFHAASVEEVAEEAGYSTGAVYSNFAGKEDLFLAVLDEHVEARLKTVEHAVAAAGTPQERARAGARDWMRFLSEHPDWYPLFIEFWAYALRDPALRRTVARRFAAFPRANARLLEQGAREAGVALPAEVAERAGVVLTALADGLALMKAMDDDAVPDDLLADTLAFLLERLAAGR